jgi:hypothetical protein
MVRFPSGRVRRGPIWSGTDSRRVACRIVTILVALASGRAARAGDDSAFAQAKRDVEASDYQAARGALASALDAGSASPQELAEIYKLSGIVESALGNTDAATEAFARWLVIDPKATLPPGTSPKIVRPFDAAAANKPPPLKVKAETSAAPPTVTLVIGDDSFTMIARARVVVVVDGKREVTLEAAGKLRITIALPTGKRLDLRVQGLDAHGNRVVELGTEDVPIVIVTDGSAPKRDDEALSLLKTKPATPSEPRPLYLKWWVWGSGAVAFGALATYFGIAAVSATNDLDRLNATSQDHTFTEALDVESRARRDVWLFDIGMGIAGAAAVTATILYLTEPRPTTETRVTAVPIHGGGAVVIGGRF